MSREINGRIVRGSIEDISDVWGATTHSAWLEKVLESLLQLNLLKSLWCTIDKIINGVNIVEYHMLKLNGLNTQGRASRTVHSFFTSKSTNTNVVENLRLKTQTSFWMGKWRIIYRIWFKMHSIGWNRVRRLSFYEYISPGRTPARSSGRCSARFGFYSWRCLQRW